VTERAADLPDQIEETAANRHNFFKSLSASKPANLVCLLTGALVELKRACYV
jgi:hypothetical protein